MAIYTDQVLILRSRPYRDHDVLLTAFGLKTGKFGAIAKGVRRSKSPLAGQVNPLTRSTFTLYHGRSNLDTVTDAALEQAFPRVSEDLERLGWAMVLVDLVDQLWPERESAVDCFMVLAGALDALNRGRSAASVGLAAGFQFLLLAGLGLNWDGCAGCGLPFVKGPVSIDLRQGAVWCPSCAKIDGASLSLGGLRSLQYWLRNDPAKFGQVEVRGHMEAELKHLLFEQVINEINRPLKSVNFLLQIDRLSQEREGGDDRRDH